MERPARSANASRSSGAKGAPKRTWKVLKSRTSQSDSISLSDVANEMNRDSILQGFEGEEAITESQVTAFVSTLFLTNRGYISLGQESGYNGQIVLQDLWGESDDYDELTQRLHPTADPTGAQNV